MESTVDLDTVQRAHFVGIAGSGMSGLAQLFLQLGKRVSGCDARPGDAAVALARQGVVVYREHAAAHVVDTELVVVSAAVTADNPDVLAARARGIPVVTHAEVLGALTARGRGVAVAGTHGKTTTTALVGFLLEQAGYDPTILAGAPMRNYGASARLGRGCHVVVEADEYAGRFLQLRPAIAVVTNMELDHLDCYADWAALRAAFAAFVARLPEDGLLVVCADDPGASQLTAPGRRLTYSLDQRDGWHARACRPVPGGMQFVAVSPEGAQVPVFLPLVGRHNVANALAALAVATAEGVPLEAGAAVLAQFRGTERRFQRVGEAAGVTVIDDYAHHPTAVRATLAAARATHAGPLWVVFQPHTRHRTAHLLAEFAAALGQADAVVVTAIYEPLGRDREAPAISGADLAARIVGPPAAYVPALEDAAAYVAARVPPGTLVLTMGAGDVQRVGPLLLARLAEGAR
jgi:UDP-N-acetylmuramate--alanine ligase